MAISNVTVAFCFNYETEAKNLAVKLNTLSPDITFITAPTFDGFLKAIASVPKIDYFIIEETFKECSSMDLIEKLKASQRYKKSLISIFSVNQKNISPMLMSLEPDFVFDIKTDFNAVHEGLEKSIIKSLTPVIPKHFNILALDDEPGILELISMHVNELEHPNIDLCKSVSEAKNLLRDKEYDLLLLDWNLGDGTCIDIMDYIKDKPVSKRTKSALTVVITGRNDVDDIMTLLRYGIKDTIIKPFDFLEFEDKITYAMEKHLKLSKS